jgi:hypothetical protein
MSEYHQYQSAKERRQTNAKRSVRIRSVTGCILAKTITISDSKYHAYAETQETTSAITIVEEANYVPNKIIS